MTAKVEISFDLLANGVGDYFTLDDTVKGVLNNTSYKLGGEVFVDLTDRVRDIQTKRGRSRLLEKFVAGSSKVRMDNRDRMLDPTNTDSPYYGSIVPRKQAQITVDGVPIFIGNVEDWDFGYTLSGDSTAEPSFVDGFATLARSTVTPGAQTSQLSGARMESVLTDIEWPEAARDIATGSATLAADIVGSDVNGLAYLQKIEVSEAGAFFMSKDGLATFRSRAEMQNFPGSGGIVFGPDDIPFRAVSVVYGTEEMANSVSVTWTSGSVSLGPVTVVDSAAVADYGYMDSSYDTLLSASADASYLANYVVAQYSHPRYRVDQITVNMNAITAAQKASLLGLELGDAVEVLWQPNNTGSVIDQFVSIDAIEHRITPVMHEMTFTLSETIAAFVLNDSYYGRLDYNVLGF